MRDIKFRQWDSRRKIMHLGSGATYPSGWVGFSCVSWEGSPLMQFTGLKDKNGKEIYEGDILSFVPVDSKNFGNPYKPFVVFWDEKDASFSGWSPRDKVEIIGNVYEQPELME